MAAEADNKTKELIRLIREVMGEKIGFTVFFTVEGDKITHLSPMFKDPKDIRHMVATMLKASKALKFAAEDMINKTLNNN